MQVDDDRVKPVKALEKVFLQAARPDNFNNYWIDDEEFAEHNETLKNRNRDTLTRADLGSVGWNPVGSMNVDGWRYWLPTLAKLALGDDWAGRGPFLWDLLIYLRDPQKNKELSKLTFHEVVAIRDFLDAIIPYVKRCLEPEVEVEHNLAPVLSQWRKFAADFPRLADGIKADAE